MKLLLLSVASLIAIGLAVIPLSKSHKAAATASFQNRGLDRYTEKTIIGSEVIARAKKLRSKNKGVARAMRDLEKKGLRPVPEQSVSFLQARKRAASAVRTNRFLKASFQSETFSEDGYEMTFISYDDGDPNTWEGVIYEHDDNGNEYSYTATFEISGEQETWNRVVETYYPANGTEPVSSDSPQYYNPSYQPYDPMQQQQQQQQQEQQISRCDTVCKDGSLGRKSLHHASPQPFCCAPRHWRDRGNRWLRCTAGGCTVSAIGCAVSGPGWPVCVKWWCGGSAAGCVILSW